MTPAVLDPQLVSVLEAHVWLHHAPWQLPLVQAVHGELVPVLHGSPMAPLVPAQIVPVAPPEMG
jgi:hypothetical protein